MSTDELKQMLKEHLDVALDVQRGDGVGVSLLWDGECISFSFVATSEFKPREVDDLLKLWEMEAKYRKR